jgi:predicted nucleic acid-binding protein
MPVVSDTSPLLGLAAIEQLELLHEQFGAVFIPEAVFTELKLEHGFRGAGLLSKTLADGWIEVRPVKNLALVKALSLDLHLGEAEAMQALRHEIGFFISDDLYHFILREAAEE